MMRRNSDHVFQFMMAELGTEGSIDGNKRLVIRGKFVPKVIKFFFKLILVTCLILFFFVFFFTVHRISVEKIHWRVCRMSNVQKF